MNKFMRNVGRLVWWNRAPTAVIQTVVNAFHQDNIGGDTAQKKRKYWMTMASILPTHTPRGILNSGPRARLMPCFWALSTLHEGFSEPSPSIRHVSRKAAEDTCLFEDVEALEKESARIQQTH